jgi:prephenate dehydrogenase
MRRLNIGTIGIVGLGYIGSSIGMRLREVGVAKRVIGFDGAETARTLAAKRGAVDDVFETLNHLGDADILVLAVPPTSTIPCLIEADVFCKLNCIVTDTGSVKGHVVNWTQTYPLRFGPRFVGGHPMVGEPGVKHKPRPDLFDKKTWVLTPTEATDKGALDAVKTLVTAIGAKPLVLTPEEHDRHAAFLSHLPHALAGVLAQVAQNLVHPEMASETYRELTKAADADAETWATLLRNNREEVVSAIEDLEFTLRELRNAVAADQHEALMEFFETSRRAIAAWAN